MQQKSDSVLARVSRELSQLEKRDWELWVIVSLAGVLVGIGFLAILFPAAFLSQGNFRFEVTVSKQLVIALATLLILLNTYLVTRRLELRKMREGLVSATIQNELVRLQSFTDPLTEIYNRRSLDDMATRYIGQARRSHKPLTFLLVDVDRFSSPIAVRASIPAQKLHPLPPKGRSLGGSWAKPCGWHVGGPLLARQCYSHRRFQHLVLFPSSSGGGLPGRPMTRKSRDAC